MNIRHCPAEEPAFDGKACGEVLDLKQRFLCANDRLDLALLATQELHGFWIGLLAHFAQLGDCGQKRFGIRVLRVLEDLFDGAFFDLIAAEHDDHAVGHLRNHGHVVRDEHHSRAGLAFQTVHQGEDLGLNGHIQRRSRFIRDQKARFTGQSHRDHDPLAHAARQFMRILRQTPLRFRDSYLPQ